MAYGDAPGERSLGMGEATGNTMFATSIALLMLRLALGFTFFFHGSQKVFGWFGGPGMEGVIKGFEHIGLPSFLPVSVWAMLAAYGELVGGTLVLLGLFARVGTLPIIVVMIMAIAKVHGPNGFSMEHMGYEYNANLIAMALAILIAGPGIVSLDALIFGKNLWARGAQPLGTAEKRVPS
jgi:putative oxidoreductase